MLFYVFPHCPLWPFWGFITFDYFHSCNLILLLILCHQLIFTFLIFHLDHDNFFEFEINIQSLYLLIAVSLWNGALLHQFNDVISHLIVVIRISWWIDPYLILSELSFFEPISKIILIKIFTHIFVLFHYFILYFSSLWKSFLLLYL